MMKNFKDIKVAVAGTGYVGLSIATLLSQHHHVTAVDVIPEKDPTATKFKDITYDEIYGDISVDNSELDDMVLITSCSFFFGRMIYPFSPW